jgi:hypothetical protein
LSQIPDGEHNIVITAWGGGFYAEGLTAYNFDMTTISVINFTVDSTSPKVSIISPENTTYDSSNVPFNFIVSESASLITYSLDGQDNSTWNGNATLAGLLNGSHNLTIYAWDLAGNLGVSKTVVFNIAKPKLEPFPTVPIVVSTVSIAIACISIILYYRKRGRGRKP